MGVVTKYSAQIIPSTDDLYPHFFCKKKFLEYQAETLGKNTVYIGVFSVHDQRLVAYCAFSGNDGHWQTPVTGAFGGVVKIHNAPIDALEFLVENIPHLLTLKGPLLSIVFKLSPGSFLDESCVIANILHRNNWILTDCDLNYHLVVCSVNDFLSGLGKTKQKLIGRLHKAGAEFLKVDREMLETVYRVIEKNRAGQGYPMTMSLDAVANLVKHFESDILLFVVTLESSVVASAICIQISPKYLYIFYWGELPDFRNKSPVLFLAKGILDFCSVHGIEIIDIGTASLNSVPNLGLCTFKASLGGRVSQKLIYKWRA